MKKGMAGLLLVMLTVLAGAQFVLPARIENSLNAVTAHDPYAVSPAARALHESLFVADLHSDSLLWKRDLRRRANRGHVDLPRLREGNVALQVFSATTKSPSGQNYARNTADSDNITWLAIASLWPPRTWGSLFERARYQAGKLQRLDATGELALLRTAADLDALIERRAQGDTVVGAVFLIEGAHPLEGRLDNLDRLYDDGLRVVGLTHFFDNELGGSLHGTSGAGLTAFGRAVVARAAELGMIVDVAHASPRMVRDVLEATDRPVMLSHGGMKGTCDTPRNLDDDLMRAIADRGGLVGIGFWDAASCDITPAGIASALRYAVDRLGLAHVALGSDYDGATTVRFDAGELAALTDALLRAGFDEAEIRAVMGDNARRFLLANLPDGATVQDMRLDGENQSARAARAAKYALR